jgi:hypothetical protein
MGTRTLLGRDWLSNAGRANREPWTVEQKLHLGLAAIAVLGWSLAYTVLTRGIDTPQDIARAEDAGTKVTVSLATPDTALSNPAGR